MVSLNRFRAVVLLGLAGIFVCLYAYFVPGGIGAARAVKWTFFETLSGDLPLYAVRFSASALFLGVGPALSMLVLYGFPRRGRGLQGTAERVEVSGSRRGSHNGFFGHGRPQERFVRWWPFWVLLAICIVSGALGSLDSCLSTFYPYSKTLALAPGGWAGFALHALLYIVLFYLPWELFFRGFLVLPLL